METLLFIGVPLVLLLIVMNPRLGTFLIWPILFTYPHSYWYTHSFLPLNIGVDDLFCIFLFLVVFVRRNLMGGVPVRLGYAFWVITGFLVVGITSNLFGLTEVIGPYRTVVIKDILKLFVFWGLFYAILHCIDDERDLRIQFYMFSVAAVVGALLVILQRFYPDTFRVFASPYVLARGGLRAESRAAGAFMHPNAAAAVLTCSLLLVITSMRLQRSTLLKLLFYGFCFVLLAGILFTQSRGGLLALLATLFLMFVFSKHRSNALILVVPIIVVVLTFPQVRQAAFERIQEIYNPETRLLGQNVESRIGIWKAYFETSTPRDYWLGQGHYAASLATGKAESHSLYVALITVYGFPGILWAFASFIRYWVKVIGIRFCQIPTLRIISGACLWALMAWGIYGITSDSLSSQYTRYILFYLVVLVDRSHVLARQSEYELATEHVVLNSPEDDAGAYIEAV
jgi:hypothetical protein